MYFLYFAIISLSFDLTVVNVFSQFCSYLSLEKGIGLHLSKLASPSSRMMLSTLVEIGPVVLEKIFIDKCHQWFSPIFQLSSIGKGCGPSFSILPKMICTKLDWNWPTDSGKRKCEKCTDSRNSSTHLSAQVSYIVKMTQYFKCFKKRFIRISSNSEYQVASFVS